MRRPNYKAEALAWRLVNELFGRPGEEGIWREARRTATALAQTNRSLETVPTSADSGGRSPRESTPAAPDQSDPTTQIPAK